MLNNSCNFFIDSYTPQIIHHVILQFFIQSAEFRAIVLIAHPFQLRLAQKSTNIISECNILDMNFTIDRRTFIDQILIIPCQNDLEITEIFHLLFLILLLVLFFFFIMRWSSTLEHNSNSQIINSLLELHSIDSLLIDQLKPIRLDRFVHCFIMLIVFLFILDFIVESLFESLFELGRSLDHLVEIINRSIKRSDASQQLSSQHILFIIMISPNCI